MTQQAAAHLAAVFFGRRVFFGPAVYPEADEVRVSDALELGEGSMAQHIWRLTRGGAVAAPLTIRAPIFQHRARPRRPASRASAI